MSETAQVWKLAPDVRKRELKPYPPYDRYGRRPERFFCRNCIIFMDVEIVAEKHREETEHEVVEIFPY